MDQTGYLKRRAAFRTRLARFGPAPKELSELDLPVDTTEIHYRSAGLELRAFYQLPGDATSTWPTVVFQHGGCGIDHQHFPIAGHFLEAGFAVFSPTMRGENGNPGHFELFFGEVDDARSAIRWLCDQPWVDTGDLYSFGWSMGGEISALLSLYPDLPLRITASSGPFFPRHDRFGATSMFGTPVPFNLDDAEEQSLRTLAGNIGDMHVPHHAFIGTDDHLFTDGEYRQIRTTGTLLSISEVPGDHDTSVHQAASRSIVAFKQEMLTSTTNDQSWVSGRAP